MKRTSQALATLSSWLAPALGATLAVAMSTASWADGHAGVAWAAIGAAVAVALSLWQRWPVALLVYAVLFAFTVVGSVAVGSSWAAATWLPALLAVFALGRRSEAFALALTATLLVIDAPTIVVLSQLFGVEGTSGSVQYFVGFVGVVAVPLWLRVAIVAGGKPWSVVLKAVAVIVAAVGVWAVLASGSRAALLGLAVALLAGLLGPLLTTSWRRIAWRPALLAVVAVGVLVPGVDFALGAAFGSGRSTAAPVASGSLDVTTAELESPAGTLGGVRIPLWRQALDAAVARPLGHGPGSYAHVNHAYQNVPLLWSGSPHSVWALALVETGWLGALALLAAAVGGLWVAWRRGGAAMPALLGATAVMSLDVFASMPIQSLLWWAVLGTAWGPTAVAKGWARGLGTAVVAAVVVMGVFFSVRLGTPCGEGCDAIGLYGGHPRLVGQPLSVIGVDPDDARWDAWRARYPLAFWLAASEAEANAGRDPTARLGLLRAYPFQSAQRYVDVADEYAGEPMAADVAACGLVRFFGDQAILRDWRSSEAELAAQRALLEERTGSVAAAEAACVRAGIPRVAIGLR